MKTGLDFLGKIDKNVSERMHDFEYNMFHSFFHAYTAFGSIHFTVLLAVVLFQMGRTALIKELAVVLGLTLLITETIKLAIKRKRPVTRDKDVYIMQNLSFPSGHSSNAFATAVVLTGVAGLGYLPLLVAALVAFSRVYLGQHYLSDVITGSIIGIVVASLL